MNKQHTCSMQEKKKKTNQQTNKQDERRIETKLRNAGSSRFFLMRLAFGPLCACVCARMFERGDTCSGLTFTNNTTTPPPAYERNRTNKRKTHREREREREREHSILLLRENQDPLCRQLASFFCYQPAQQLDAMHTKDTPQRTSAQKRRLETKHARW